MARPVVSDLTTSLYDSLGGWLTSEDEANDWTLLKMCAAWVETLLDPVYELAREGPNGEPPWSRAFDPDEAPAFVLPYLAQYVGVFPEPSWSEQQLRDEIKHPTGWKRGQIESIKIAVRRTLVAPEGEDAVVIIHSRTPEAGSTYVRTLLSQTPDEARTAAVVRAEVPAWNLVDYAAFVGMTYADSTAKFSTYALRSAAYPTYADATEETP